MDTDSSLVKRALRALESPAYEKARKKNPLLPEITDRASLENTFKLLPLGMLALRVSKVEPQAAAQGGKKPKRVKGQWTVKIEQHQEAKDDMYYAWFWEGSQVKRQLYAALALVVIFAVVLYPLWPLKLRLGVYYLSWGLLGLLGLFFVMAIFRVILFCITYFVVPPGLWLYPNLWEDVSFMDSFRPVWAWHEVRFSLSLPPSLPLLPYLSASSYPCHLLLGSHADISQTEKPKKKKKKAPVTPATNPTMAAATGQVESTATTTGTDTQLKTGLQQRSYEAPKVEETGDDE